jgi:uncharacterized protein (TIGR02246 family)
MSFRLVVGACAIAAACAPANRGAASDLIQAGEVRQALDRYMRAARAVDAAGIAASFAADGVLFEPGIAPVEGREAIRTFAASFPGVRVDTATATPDTIEVFGETVLVWGSYFEKLAFPGQPASEQHGRFVMEWKQQPDRTWLIQRYFRVPSS